MKSNYSTTRPLMKMFSPEMMSSRPQHEIPKPETVVAGTTQMQRTGAMSVQVKK